MVDQSTEYSLVRGVASKGMDDAESPGSDGALPYMRRQPLQESAGMPASHCASAAAAGVNVPSPCTFRFSTTTVTGFPSGPIVKVTPLAPTAFSPSAS
jgi:hypothetical protein